VVKKLGTSLDRCWFYTDSSEDLPLLAAVGFPVAVNPSEKLAAHARAKAWPRLEFQSRGIPSLESLLRTLLAAQTVAATTAATSMFKRMGFSSFNNTNSITRFLGDVGANFAGLDFDVEGAEHLNHTQPTIFIFNHQSLLDAVVLARLLRGDVVAFCKREMADNPLIGPLLKQVDTIFVDREGSDQHSVLKEAQEVLAGGRSLVIAPEGTRSVLGNIQPFKPGAFLLAKKAAVPIVPIVLHNVMDALPKGGFIIRAATIKITVLPPLYPGQIGSVRQTCRAIENQYREQLRKSPRAVLPYLGSL
jgi:putative phosphoserine phosphatase/1-acylglycerol-3-phosphate O-acyltransferase